MLPGCVCLTQFGGTAIANVVCMNPTTGYTPDGRKPGMRLLFEFGCDPTIEHTAYGRDAFGYAEKFADKPTQDLLNELAAAAKAKAK